MKLYKYTHKEYADSALKNGEFRISTLQDLRAHEHSEIGDENEGVICHNLDLHHRESIEKFKKDFPNFKDLYNSKSFLDAFNENVCMAIVEASNEFVYSMTSDFNEDLMLKLGYDACIEIFNPIAFLDQITISLKEHSNWYLLASCRYEPTWNTLGKHQGNSTFSKDVQYAYQKEIRALWLLKFKMMPIKTHNIYNKNASLFCKRKI